MRQHILLNPGPVNVSPRVQQALLRGDLCHREEEFSDLLVAIRTKLLQAFAPSGGYTAVPVTGSGTLAVESMVSSALPDGKKLLVINNGVYGERMLRMAEAHRIPTVELRYEWTQRPDLHQIETTLRDDPAIHAVAYVHHETTTGLLNLVTEVGTITHRAGRWLLLDAVSSLAAEDLDLVRDHVDLVRARPTNVSRGYLGSLLSSSAMKEWQRCSSTHAARSICICRYTGKHMNDGAFRSRHLYKPGMRSMPHLMNF